jgi:hypothetical protein
VGARALPLRLSLHPAEHRAVRELHAMGRALALHWSRLADRLGGPAADALRSGAATSRALLDALSYRTDVPAGFPAAQGVGGWLAAVRGNARDVVLERNQALRLSVSDAHHITILLGYLAELASDPDLAAFWREWETQFGDVEASVEEAVLALAADPDAAVEPADPGPAGRAGHGLANAFGTFGEAFDASPVGRAARRLR